MAPRPSLSHKQLRAIQLLLDGTKFVDIAMELGINRTTLYLWRNDPDFIKVLEEERMSQWYDTEQTIARTLKGAAMLMATRGMQILNKNPRATTLDGAKLIKQSIEMLESTRPKTEAEQILETLGISGDAIKQGLLPSSTSEVVMRHLGAMQAELQAMGITDVGKAIATENGYTAEEFDADDADDDDEIDV